MYANAFRKLEAGRCRYGLMLTEAGFLMDDGVIARIAPDRFHVTTTTGGAPRVLAHMEDYLQTEFTDLKVWLTSTTEQWAVIAVQGPKARDCDRAARRRHRSRQRGLAAHERARRARLRRPARLMRVSFTGELGFEINVPAGYGRDVWEAVWREVEKHGGCAYGTEAMHVMRAEKGYVIVGQDTDGTVTLADLGLDWAIGKMKRDFVGKRSLSRPDIVRDGRKQLVGLLTDDPNVVLEEGAQVTESAQPPVGSPALGHVTSSYRSATLGRSIALALVAAGRSRMGAKLYAPMPNGAVAVSGFGAGLLRQGRERGSMSDPWLAPRFPFDDMPLPAGPRVCPRRHAARRPVHPPRRRGRARRLLARPSARSCREQLGPAGEGEERAALWLGPDEWLLIAGSEEPDNLAFEIEDEIGAVLHSLVDVSHRQVGLVVKGALAARALSAGCPLDLRLTAFPVGMATRTIFDKAEIVLWRQGELEFRVEVGRSFAPYLVAALTEAARGAPEF